MFTEMEKQYLANRMDYLKHNYNKQNKFYGGNGCGGNGCRCETGNRNLQTGNRNINVGTGISFSCDKCNEIWMPWPFDNITFCLRSVLDTLAEGILQAAIKMGSETACDAIVEAIVQTAALANMEDGIGEAMEIILNPVVIGALCNYIFEEVIPRYGKTYTDQAKNDVLNWLCQQF